MAKANRKVLRDRKGTMGIGTMIIFIATIITAAVASGVLIYVNQQLRTQALKTGEGAMKGLTTLVLVDGYMVMETGNIWDKLFEQPELLKEIVSLLGIIHPGVGWCTRMLFNAIVFVPNSAIKFWMPLVKTIWNTVPDEINDFMNAFYARDILEIFKSGIGFLPGAMTAGLSFANDFFSTGDEMQDMYLEVKVQEGSAEFPFENLKMVVAHDGSRVEWTGEEAEVISVVADADGSMRSGAISGGDRMIFKLSDLPGHGVHIEPNEPVTIEIAGKYGTGDEWQAVMPVYSDRNHWELEAI